jgi:hypothetical protein
MFYINMDSIYPCHKCPSSAVTACKCKGKTSYLCSVHLPEHLQDKSVVHLILPLEMAKTDPVNDNRSSRLELLRAKLQIYKEKVQTQFNSYDKLGKILTKELKAQFDSSKTKYKSILAEINSKTKAIDDSGSKSNIEVEYMLKTSSGNKLSSILLNYEKISDINIYEILSTILKKIGLDPMPKQDAPNLRNDNELETLRTACRQKDKYIQELLGEMQNKESQLKNVAGQLDKARMEIDQTNQVANKYKQTQEALSLELRERNSMMNSMNKDKESLDNYARRIKYLEEQNADKEFRIIELLRKVKESEETIHQLMRNLKENEDKLKHHTQQRNQVAQEINYPPPQNFYSFAINQSPGASSSSSEPPSLPICSINLIHTLKGHTNTIRSTVLTSDGQFIISGSSDRTIRIWNLRTGGLESRLLGHSDMVLSLGITHDDRYLVSAGWDNSLLLWNLATRKIECQITGNSEIVWCIAVTHNNEKLVFGTGEFTIKIWNLRTRQYSALLGGHEGSVSCIAVTQDDKYIISGSEDKTIRGWKLSNNQQEFILTGHNGYVMSVCISVDNQFIITGSQDKTLKVWSLQNKRAVATLAGHSRSVESVSISRDGRYVISGSADGTVRVWNFETKTQEKIIQAHSSAVLSLGLTKDNTRMVTSSGEWLTADSSTDCTVKVWSFYS